MEEALWNMTYRDQIPPSPAAPRSQSPDASISALSETQSGQPVRLKARVLSRNLYELVANDEVVGYKVIRDGRSKSFTARKHSLDAKHTMALAFLSTGIDDRR